MGNFLSDHSKLLKTALKDDNFLNFITSQEKRTDKIYKKLVDSNSMSEETRRHLKPVGTRPRITCRSCKEHKKVSIVVHFSDQFYLLYKHLHTSLQCI